jgi:nitrate reductase NapE component
LNALITALTLLLTIFVAMAVGIYTGYGMLMGLLRIMGHRTEPASTTPVLVTSQAHSGD